LLKTPSFSGFQPFSFVWNDVGLGGCGDTGGDND